MAPPVNHARSGESSWVEATLPGPNICGIAKRIPAVRIGPEDDAVIARLDRQIGQVDRDRPGQVDALLACSTSAAASAPNTQAAKRR